MKTPERFDRAISALVSAYMNDTLAKGKCSACAVGNIIAYAKGYKVSNRHPYGWKLSDQCGVQPSWHEVFVTSEWFGQVLEPNRYSGKAKNEIDSTGYSWQELARVELAFETSTKINSVFYDDLSKDQISADQYNGLMAVVDVLCQIEGIADPAEYKALFAVAS